MPSSLGDSEFWENHCPWCKQDIGHHLRMPFPTGLTSIVWRRLQQGPSLQQVHLAVHACETLPWKLGHFLWSMHPYGLKWSLAAGSNSKKPKAKNATSLHWKQKLEVKHVSYQSEQSVILCPTWKMGKANKVSPAQQRRRSRKQSFGCTLHLAAALQDYV